MRFLFNILLAVVWCLLTVSMHPWNFVAGLAIGAAVISVYGRVTGGQHYMTRMFRLLGFAWYFTVILIKANLQIARAILTPGWDHQPAILRYNVAGLSDIERTTLANCITLTPGTLVVDVSPCGSWLYIHAMYAANRDAAIANIDELAARLRKGVFS